MLTFNDLVTIDKRGFQTLLREVSTEDLAVAMKTASDEMQEKIFSNLSSRAVDQIKEEIELLGPDEARRRRAGAGADRRRRATPRGRRPAFDRHRRRR